MWSSNAVRALGAAALVALCAPAMAVEDLRALEVVGQRGQSLEQTRRDRYECHNWSVAQTGETPLAPTADEREPRDAVIGAGLGSLFGNGRRHDAGERVLAGAAVGAAIGAATADGREREVEAEVPEPSDYLRALTACLEGRGYSVHLPTVAELTASR